MQTQMDAIARDVPTDFGFQLWKALKVLGFHAEEETKPFGKEARKWNFGPDMFCAPVDSFGLFSVISYFLLRVIDPADTEKRFLGMYPAFGDSRSRSDFKKEFQKRLRELAVSYSGVNSALAELAGQKMEALFYELSFIALERYAARKGKPALPFDSDARTNEQLLPEMWSIYKYELPSVRNHTISLIQSIAREEESQWKPQSEFFASEAEKRRERLEIARRDRDAAVQRLSSLSSSISSSNNNYNSSNAAAAAAAAATPLSNSFSSLHSRLSSLLEALQSNVCTPEAKSDRLAVTRILQPNPKQAAGSGRLDIASIAKSALKENSIAVPSPSVIDMQMFAKTSIHSLEMQRKAVDDFYPFVMDLKPQLTLSDQIAAELKTVSLELNEQITSTEQSTRVLHIQNVHKAQQLAFKEDGYVPPFPEDNNHILFSAAPKAAQKMKLVPPTPAPSKALNRYYNNSNDEQEDDTVRHSDEEETDEEEESFYLRQANTQDLLKSVMKRAGGGGASRRTASIEDMRVLHFNDLEPSISSNHSLSMSSSSVSSMQDLLELSKSGSKKGSIASKSAKPIVPPSAAAAVKKPLPSSSSVLPSKKPTASSASAPRIAPSTSLNPSRIPNPKPVVRREPAPSKSSVSAVAASQQSSLPIRPMELDFDELEKEDINSYLPVTPEPSFGSKTKSRLMHKEQDDMESFGHRPLLARTPQVINRHVSLHQEQAEEEDEEEIMERNPMNLPLQTPARGQSTKPSALRNNTTAKKSVAFRFSTSPALNNSGNAKPVVVAASQQKEEVVSSAAVAFNHRPLLARTPVAPPVSNKIDFDEEEMSAAVLKLDDSLRDLETVELKEEKREQEEVEEEQDQSVVMKKNGAALIQVGDSIAVGLVKPPARLLKRLANNKSAASSAGAKGKTKVAVKKSDDSEADEGEVLLVEPLPLTTSQSELLQLLESRSRTRDGGSDSFSQQPLFAPRIGSFEDAFAEDDEEEADSVHMMDLDDDSDLE